MIKFWSWLWLMIVVCVFFFINTLIFFVLTGLIAERISDGVSYFGVPVGIFPAMIISFFIDILVVIPLLLIFARKLHKKVSTRYKLEKTNRVLTIVSILIVFILPLLLPIGRAVVETLRQREVNSSFETKIKITDEKISEISKNIGKTVRNVTVYQYTININNQTDKTYSAIVEIIPGHYQGKYLFDQFSGKSVHTRLEPGDNTINGEFELSRDMRNDPFPESGRMPISITFVNHNLNLYKEMYIFSDLPEWKTVFYALKTK